MALNHGTKPIVTDGLVLCLDAGDKNSYPGSGTTWYDLSGKGNNATLSDVEIGTVSSSLNTMAANSGSASTGYGQEITIGSSIAGCETSTGTISCWVNMHPKTLNSGVGLWHFHDGQSAGKHVTDYITCRVTADNNMKLLIEDENVTELWTQYDLDNLYGAGAFVDKWLYIVWLQDGSSVKLYINGELISMSADGNNGSWWTNHLSIDEAIVMGVATWSNADHMLSIFNIYNRALTSTEVKQNFNAHRHRFGV